MFGSINSLQIVAHIPLINITFVSMSYFVFDILIQLICFDYLPMELIDFGFTETEPWNSRFLWLGYDSANYVELLGSISVFIVINILHGLLIYSCMTLRLKKIKSLTDSTKFKQAQTLMFIEAFLELTICGGIGFKQLETRAVWNTQDKMAFAFLIMMVVATTVFIIKSLMFQYTGLKEMQE